MSFPILFPIDPGAKPDTQEVPGQLSGLSLWYRSDDVVLTDGNKVLQWPDRSGNGYHVAAQTIVQRPGYFTDGTLLNGLPYISGSGTQCLFTTGFTELNGLPGATLFVVSHTLQPHPFGGSSIILNTPTDVYALPNKSNINFFYQASSTNPLSIFFNANLPSPPANSSTSTIPLAQATLTVPCIYSMNIDRNQSGAAGTVAWNGGAPITLSKLPASNTFVAGNLGFTSGVVVGALRADGVPTGVRPGVRTYEIILYNRILSTLERNQVHNYLSTRYNIPVV